MRALPNQLSESGQTETRLTFLALVSIRIYSGPLGANLLVPSGMWLELRMA
jgi:hypothetical protein